MDTTAVLPTVDSVSKMIDHAILKPTITYGELEQELAVAAHFNAFSVCVRPADVSFAVDTFSLSSSPVQVGTVVGFPHGSTSTAAKVAEVEQGLRDGATEFDMVLNIGALRSGRPDLVEADIAAVKRAAGAHILKVIFETDMLTDTEKRLACQASAAAGADFVKTSTGFSTGGATAEDLCLMRQASPKSVAVKASGGVRSLDTLLEFLELGATRFGTSATATILEELERRHRGEAASHREDLSSY